MCVCVSVPYRLKANGGGDGIEESVGMREVREASGLDPLEVHGLT